MIIIQDSKEKIPWNFEIFDKCYGQIVSSLTTGDYSVEGYEDIIAIERKRTTAELANNLGKEYSRFEREFKRLSLFKYKYLICEFSESDIYSFPFKSGIPRNKWSRIRMSGKFIFKRMVELCNFYDVEFFLCEDRETAERKALELLEFSIRDYKENGKYSY